MLYVLLRCGYTVFFGVMWHAMPLTGVIVLVKEGRRPAVHAFVARTSLVALISPRGVWRTLMPEDEVVRDVTGVVVWTFSLPGYWSSSLDKRPVTNLYGQNDAQGDENAATAPLIPVTLSAMSGPKYDTCFVHFSPFFLASS